jgi:putative sporulation protein YtaF
VGWFGVLYISIANNLDTIAVGVTYGVGKIRIRWLANLWMGIVQLAITAAAVYFGQWLAHWVSHTAAHLASAAVFCGLGIWMLLPSMRKAPADSPDGENGTPRLLRVLQEPQLADRDRSREIDLAEATLLGIALSLNNVAGGVSAGLIHLNAAAVAICSAAISCLVIELGNRSAHRLIGAKTSDRAQVIAGLLLLAFGVFQLR